MKEIMKEHGGLLVTVAVTICILTIIFSSVIDSDANRVIVRIRITPINRKNHSSAYEYGWD